MKSRILLITAAVLFVSATMVLTGCQDGSACGPCNIQYSRCPNCDVHAKVCNAPMPCPTASVCEPCVQECPAESACPTDWCAGMIDSAFGKQAQQKNEEFFY